jgi:phosphopantothenoylcysteine decarboxylase/phosphopantothenate--cysteine ligase
MFQGKHILLGITGGIAAYKSAYLVRELVRAGAEVQVVMTPAATEFITPLTLSVLSRREVVTEMFSPVSGEGKGGWTKHIDLATWADIMLVAPASANTIAKLAHGLADNFLTTLVLALRCPLVVAPAMDLDMYQNRATQRNLAVLREQGCLLIDPEQGELASGLVGPGRLPEVGVLLEGLSRALSGAEKDFLGRRVLVTAGPTHERIDPVRYIGNRSSGKMGFALAAAAAQRGAEVVLVSGPVSLTTPRHVRRVDVESAVEMERAVFEEFDRADVLVMAAAVADFSPGESSVRKLKREEFAGGVMRLELRSNPDILKAAGQRKKHQILVGFALETENAVEHGREKLLEKKCDLIVLNSAVAQGAGIGAETNRVTFLTAGAPPEPLPELPKIEVAHRILTKIEPLLARV